MNYLDAKIDFHVHYLPQAYKEAVELHGGGLVDKFPTPPWSVEQHLEDMEKLKIATAFLSLSSPHLSFGSEEKAKTIARKSNEEGAEIVRKYPERFGLFASLPLPNVQASLKEIEYASTVLKADAIELPTNARGVYLGDPKLDPVFELLNQYKSVVHIHPNRPSQIPENVIEKVNIPAVEFFFDTTRTVVNLIVNGVFLRYPDIKWVVPHAGALLPLLADRLNANFVHGLIKCDGEVPDIYAQLNNLYYDVAGFCVPRQLSALFQIADISHMLYGSDYSYTPAWACSWLADDLEKTELLSAEDRQAIFGENAVKLIPRLIK